MLDVYTAKAGNVLRAGGKESAYKGGNGPTDGNVVDIERAGMAKSRQRVKTRSGTEIGIDIGYGRTLRHGDILQSGDDPRKPVVVVRQVPEKVIQLRFKGSRGGGDGGDGSGSNREAWYELPVIVGHIIGNRHRPVSVRRDSISFPIQDDAELETFSELLAGVSDRIDMHVTEEIFVPHSGADVHDHR